MAHANELVIDLDAEDVGRIAQWAEIARRAGRGKVQLKLVVSFNYENMRILILTGQIPQEDVPKIMAENPDFAEWYKQQGHIL
ncbi:MAG TPA: hypothetical protein VFQ31_01165 [Methyloceanibacter sp.]|nr:hypothetical protein [Methyloceanibacter sp.]